MLEVVVPRKGERHWQNQPDLILTVRINYCHEHDEPQPILSSLRLHLHQEESGVYTVYTVYPLAKILVPRNASHYSTGRPEHHASRLSSACKLSKFLKVWLDIGQRYVNDMNTLIISHH